MSCVCVCHYVQASVNKNENDVFHSISFPLSILTYSFSTNPYTLSVLPAFT